MRPFDFTSPLPIPDLLLKTFARARVAPARDGFRFHRDVIGAVIVSAGTFTVVWMVAIVSAVLLLNRG